MRFLNGYRKNKDMKKALIAMSGGVDSSVAALKMKESGYDCIGCTMKLFEPEDAGVERERGCCSLLDVEDARSVAFRLQIPYYVFNFTDIFRRTVIGHFASCYERGITPNPCIDCNRYLKFEALYHRAEVLGCDCLVTGHYARIERRDGRYLLKKALDAQKDQSYFLYMLTQEQLAHTVFPLGTMEKREVRAIAEKHGFRNAGKPDSQDICFVPDGDYAGVIQRFTGLTPKRGEILDRSGNVLGMHKGIIHYTVGQRRGLGLSAAKPLYVCEIDAARNVVVLGAREALFIREAVVGDFHWISGEVPRQEVHCGVKIRYRQREQPAIVTPIAKDLVRILFAEPQRAVTPGQAAVLYDGETVLGGGTIRNAKQCNPESKPG